MARNRQYELYDGDGETIPEEYAGPRQKFSESPYAQGGMPPESPPPETAQRTRFSGRSRYNDGLADSSTLFDDFDRFNGNQTRDSRFIPQRKKKK